MNALMAFHIHGLYIREIDNLYFKSVIILHSKHELPGLLADYKITIQNITYRV